MHLRIFGCRAHIHVPDEKCHKLNTQSIKCVFLGFAENHKAYICVHCPSGQIFESRDVVFDEGSTNTPSHMKIDDLYLNIEETKWSAAGMSPEVIERNADSPDEDGKTTKGNQPPDGAPSMGNLQRGSMTTEVH